MQNYIKTIGALAAASALVAGNAKAEVEYEIHTGYTSDYIWRGYDLGEDLIEAGVDVAGEWNGIGLSGGIWAATFDEWQDEIDQEVDFYAEASYDLGFMSVATGYIYYYLAETFGVPDADSQEVYFSVAKDWGFVDTSFTYYWDVQGADNDGYSVLALSRGFELNPCLTLNVGTSFAYLFEETEFADWNTKVSLDWGFTETATLSPFIAYSYNMSDDYETITGTDDKFYGGVMLSVSF